LNLEYSLKKSFFELETAISRGTLGKFGFDITKKGDISWNLYLGFAMEEVQKHLEFILLKNLNIN